MSKKQIYSTQQQYLNKGYTLCPDTSFLMNTSELLTNHSDEKLLSHNWYIMN